MTRAASSTADAEAAARRPAWMRVAALSAGLLLLAAALVAVARQHESIREAAGVLRDPAPWAVATLPGAIAANLILSGLLFRVPISRYGQVRLLEMQALIAAATLMNFVPFRPGLFGRIAYHRAFNAIPAAASARTVLDAVALSVLVAGYVAGALAAGAFLGVPIWIGAGLPVPVLLAAATWPPGRIWAIAALLRYLEIGAWAARYHAAFTLVGSPIGPGSALAFACVSSLAMLVPLVGNGLGVREWATGLAAPLLTPYVLQAGLVAELLNRAAEIVVVSLLGLAAMAGLAWYRRS